MRMRLLSHIDNWEVSSKHKSISLLLNEFNVWLSYLKYLIRFNVPIESHYSFCKIYDWNRIKHSFQYEN